MAHPAQMNELLELPGDELGTVVRNDSRPRLGELLVSTLKDRPDLQLSHPLADFPVDEIPAVTVEDTAKRVELSADPKELKNVA
jgi:hypothetical protein